jgi:hypothetical protein
MEHEEANDLLDLAQFRFIGIERAPPKRKGHIILIFHPNRLKRANVYAKSKNWNGRLWRTNRIGIDVDKLDRLPTLIKRLKQRKWKHDIHESSNGNAHVIIRKKWKTTAQNIAARLDLNDDKRRIIFDQYKIDAGAPELVDTLFCKKWGEKLPKLAEGRKNEKRKTTSAKRIQVRHHKLRRRIQRGRA